MTEEIIKEINQSTLALLQTLDLHDRYKAAVEEATRIAGAQYGTILIYKNNKFQRVYSTVPKGLRTKPRKKGYAFEAYNTSQIHIMSPLVLKEAHKSLYDKGVRCLILIPLSVKDQKIGVLSLQSDHAKKFTQVELQLITLFGSLVTLALRNAEFFDQAQKSIEARDLFISLASHELKTPLTTIIAYSDLLAKKLHSKKIPSENAVEIIRSEANRLKHIINELLRFGNTTSSQLRYKWKSVDMVEVIKKSIINFRTINPKHKILVENTLKRIEHLIQGDPEKLQQVFSNILNNSAKFSPSHIPIIIRLEANSTKITVTFTDFGKGIKKSEQAKIFNEFYKAEGNTKEGMGLGLYLVKKIIKKHKGEILLTSKVNHGTNMAIELPRRLYD